MSRAATCSGIITDGIASERVRAAAQAILALLLAGLRGGKA
ncbi:MAG: hypothetical protein ACAI35_12185 [Candidatus Methylacidiphilales bacterium]|nr:hypothetical protein [Candidatus Methylacidiphilales bacterium]